VLDIRPRFGLEPQGIRVSDHFVIAHAGDRDVAIVVDAAEDVVSSGADTEAVTMNDLAGLGGIERVVVQGGDIVPIQDLTRFLPADPRGAVELKLAA
jgi:purine-binding chemotaxis protein CheW